METLLPDLRYSVRLLIKSPVFAAVAIIALSLGIGATTAIFSVVNAVLLKPLQFRGPDRIVQIWGKFDRQGIPQNWISEPEFADLRAQARSFESMAAYVPGGANLTGTGDPVRVNRTLVSASFFPLLGIDAARGRVFIDDEDRPGANNETILGDALWRSHFGADPSVVGKTVELSGQSYVVVGIMPRGFSYPDKTDMWSPIGLGAANPEDRGSHSLDLLGKLTPGVTHQQASSELSSIANALLNQYPKYYGNDSGWGLYAVPLKVQLVGDTRSAMLVLLGAVLFLLLIACANIANLLLARATVREKEIAVRAALGAGRGRIVRQLLTESVMLALAGGTIGFGLGYAAVRAFVAFGPKATPRIAELAVNWPVLGFAVAVSFLTGLVFGLVPAVQLSRTDLNHSLKESGRAQSRSRGGLRNVFVVSEIALAMVLLAGAGLMIKSFGRLMAVPLGFNPGHLLAFRIALPEKAYPEDSRVGNFYDRLLDSLRSIPGVESAGAISRLPLSGSYASGKTIIEDTSAGPGLPRAMGRYPFIEADRRVATPGYFESLQVPLLEGRLFTPFDNVDGPRVVIIDENFARTFWPTADPLGKRVLIGGTPDKPDWGTIVGVVAHVRHYGLEKEGREQIYFSLDQEPANTMYLSVRTHGDPLSVTGAIRSAVSSLDRGEPMYEVNTMDQLLSNSIAQPRLLVSLFVAFAGVALILAVVGIYGVMSYSVTQRTAEIGVRVALGARKMDVLRLVFFRGLVLTIAGLAIGLGGAMALTRLMGGMLYAVRPTDPATFAAISAVLAVAALSACAIPAQRATRVDPMVALRYE
ncbi:MAG TPA: ABC transporter permease [Blastocatellia bacterium]